MIEPQLFVFAGPNGAGKSTLSEAFVSPGTFVFDGDKEILMLKQKFPETYSSNIFDAVNGHVFEGLKEKAISVKSDFGFETNFRVKDVMNTVNQFKKAGYQTRLIFIGLDSLQASIDRVNLRVKNGGHFVDIANITANYHNGMDNLVRYYRDFDSVLLLDTHSSFKLTPLLAIEKGVITEQAQALPDWANAIPLDIQKGIEFKQQRALELENEQKKVQNRDQDRSRGLSI
ncbi:MAG: zeta toxin family protein [Bacteroidota bacterium]